MKRPRCKNCGDEFSFGNRSDGERETLGFCVSCFSTWKRNREALRDAGYRLRNPVNHRDRDADYAWD